MSRAKVLVSSDMGSFMGGAGLGLAAGIGMASMTPSQAMNASAGDLVELQTELSTYKELCAVKNKQILAAIKKFNEASQQVLNSLDGDKRKVLSNNITTFLNEIEATNDRLCTQIFGNKKGSAPRKRQES